MKQIKIGLLSLLVAIFAITGIAMADDCYGCHGDQHFLAGIEQTADVAVQTQIGQDAMGLSSAVIGLSPTDGQLNTAQKEVELTGEELCACEAYQDGTSGALSGVIANGNGAISISGGNAQTNIDIDIHQGWLDSIVADLGTDNDIVCLGGANSEMGGSHAQTIRLAA